MFRQKDEPTTVEERKELPHSSWKYGRITSFGNGLLLRGAVHPERPGEIQLWSQMY